MVLVHLFASDHACRVAPGIDLIVMSLLGVEIRFEDQTAARHIHVLADHPLQLSLQLVWTVQIALYIADVVDGTHIHVGEHTTDLLVCVQDDALIARLGLTGHAFPRDCIDDCHNGSEHDQQHHHNPQAQSVCKRSFLHRHKVLNRTIPESRPSKDRDHEEQGAT